MGWRGYLVVAVCYAHYAARWLRGSRAGWD
jgi:hypothetical protein